MSAFSAVLTNPGLRRIMLALGCSLIGDLAYATAVTVWAYGVGGVAAVGVFAAARFILIAVGAPFISMLADRLPRKPVMMASDVVRAVLVLAAAALVEADGPVIPVFVIAVLAALVGCAFRPAQASLVPSLARTPDELTATNGVASTLDSLACFVGPAVGALLLTVADVPTVFAFDALTFLCSAALLVAVRSDRVEAGSAERPDEPVATAQSGRSEDHPGFWSEFTAGFRQILADGNLSLVTALAAAQTVVAGASTVFLVSIAVDVVKVGPKGVGYLDAALGVGAVLGGLVAMSRSGKSRLGLDMRTGIMLWSLPIIGVAVWPHPVVALAAMLMIGVGNPLVDVNFYTIMQRLVPDQVMARVFGAIESTVVAAMALGAILMPVLIAVVGLRWSLAALGTAVALIAVLCTRRLARLDAGLREPRGLGLLRRVPVFAPLKPAVVEGIAHQLTRIEVPAGRAVIREGSRGDRFYIIETGAVTATHHGETLSRSGPGDAFGEIALLHDVPRTATVTTLEPTVLFALDRDAFLAALAGDLRANQQAEMMAARRIPTT